MGSEQMDKLQELYNRYLEDSRFEHLRRPNINFVPACGPLNPSLMLIGEAPGRMENAKKIPFVGKAGIHLTNLLQNIKVNSNDVFMTNVVKYWPQDPGDTSTTRTPTDEEIAACREYLLEEIDIVNPLVVGLCGRSALQAIYPEFTEVYKHLGKLLDDMYVPLYHPAVLCYTPEKKDIVQMGFNLLKRHIDDLSNKEAC